MIAQKKLSFDVENSAMLHGFAGYFESELFGQVTVILRNNTSPY